MKAVVTGATGFIGWHLCEHLSAAGHRVLALTRPGGTRPLPSGVERRVVSYTAGDVEALLEPGDILFHLAGATRASNRASFLRANAHTTREVALASARAGSRLVYVSSQAAAGPSGRAHPRTESDAPSPISEYGESKLAGEEAVREVTRLAWTILRPVAVYGPYDRDFLTLFRLAARGVFPVVGPADTPFLLIHVTDLVRGIALASGTPAALGQVFFMGHPAIHDTASILSTLASVAGRPYRPVRIPRIVLRAAAWGGDLGGWFGGTGLLNSSRLKDLSGPGYVCSVEHAASCLGFRASIDLETGFAETLRWYRAKGLVG